MSQLDSVIEVCVRFIAREIALKRNWQNAANLK